MNAASTTMLVKFARRAIRIIIGAIVRPGRGALRGAGDLK
jgi:hypothetical protein